MLTGTADIEALAAGAAVITAYQPDAVTLEDVCCLQVTAEMDNRAREAVLPPSLHPTVPPALSIQAWDVGGSPWGPFMMVVSRVYCRSGVRARGFTVSTFVSTDEAAKGLSRVYGFPAVQAGISFRHGYDGADLHLQISSESAMVISAIDPEPMGQDDVQYTSTLNLAQTPNGLRLVQVEADHYPDRVDRLSAGMPVFNGGLVGNPLLVPRRIVSASMTSGKVELPALRFVCRPDELAFTGTEPVNLS